MKSKIFVHTFEIFNGDILVCIGVKKAEEIKKWLTKNGTKQINKAMDNKDYEIIQDTINKNSGFIYAKIHNDKYYFFLWLNEFQNKWKHFELLLHELTHYKQYQFENKLIKDENEFEAYFMESCFRSLRSRLFKELKI